VTLSLHNTQAVRKKLFGRRFIVVWYCQN